MVYGKVDSVDYKVEIKFSAQNVFDATKYLIDHSSEENLSIDNNKIALNFKLIKDLPLADGTMSCFIANESGENRLTTDCILQVYVKYSDNEAWTSKDILKSYAVTNWTISEPANVISINGVDLAYKITNRISNRIYGQIANGSITTATGTTFTDSGANFETKKTDKYENGLYYQTLELTDNDGDSYLYLITTNTSTTCTTHKTIITPTSGWDTYRIGWSSASAIYESMKRVVRTNNGRGELWDNVKTVRTTDINDDYKYGIQFLRYKDGSTEPFPIVSIGEPYLPIYRLIKELSSFTACNTAIELESRFPTIARDMVYSVIWNEELNKTVVNWFYISAPIKGDSVGGISVVTENQVTVYSGLATDLGKMMRISFKRRNRTYKKSYLIIAVSGNYYTLASDPLSDGILAGDTYHIYSNVDFVWDNEEDFKHIYDIKLGSKDDEKFNQIMFNAGHNEVSGKDILGHWFNEQTQADTLKDTFIPMTSISRQMMKSEQDKDHIRLVGETWEGWDGSAWTSSGSSWSFTTDFGIEKGTIYSIGSRTDFNSNFKLAARKKAKENAKSIAIYQKENTLKGTLQVRGQRFVSLTSSGADTVKWFTKGTKILFKKSDIALNNVGRNYYTLIVTKLRHSIDNTKWVTFMDVEYDLYSTDELIGDDN